MWQNLVLLGHSLVLFTYRNWIFLMTGVQTAVSFLKFNDIWPTFWHVDNMTTTFPTKQRCELIFCEILHKTSVIKQKSATWKWIFHFCHNWHSQHQICSKLWESWYSQLSKMCYISWVGPINLVVVRRYESFLC